MATVTRSASGPLSRPPSAERERRGAAAVLPLSARRRNVNEPSQGCDNGFGAGDVELDVSSQVADQSFGSVPAAKIRVICRLRPMSELERKSGAVPAVTAFTERQEVVASRVLGERQSRVSFHFDHVLSSFSTQRDVFAVTLKPLIRDALAGYEAAIFAYGQTGTGKTYTMEGDLDSSERRGLVPRAAEALIRALGQGDYRDYSVVASCLEIYNEELNDLLSLQAPQQKLELKETGHGVCCVGLSETQVSSLCEIQELIRRAQDRRRVAETRFNARSSRSHCLFTFKVTCRQRVEGGEIETSGKLHLVDLAGSECARNCGSYASQEACVKNERERRNINQSLLTLGRVIAALRDESSRVPYRDSKLTRMLQEALGGGCRTVMIATISPAQSVIDETLSTLQYAEQATGIQNKLIQSSMFRSGNVTPVLECRCACGGDWGPRGDISELEMRLEYLTQEVEEAHAAFERKQREATDLHGQLDAKDSTLKEAVCRLERAEQKIVEQRYLLDKTADFADERNGDVNQLSDALVSTWQRCMSLSSQISDQKSQVRDICAQTEEHAAALSSTAQVSAGAVFDASETARRTHRDGVETMAGIAAEQAQIIAQLVEAVNLRGNGVQRDLLDTVGRLNAEWAKAMPVAQEPNGQASKQSLAALEQALTSRVEDVKRHSADVRDIHTQLLEESNVACSRRASTQDAIEQLVANYRSRASSQVQPLTSALQSFDRQLEECGGALTSSLSLVASQLASAKSSLAAAASQGESRVKETLGLADTALTELCAQAGEQLDRLRDVLCNAQAKLRSDATSEAMVKRLTDVTTMVAVSSQRELAALDAARKAVADDLASMREQLATEKEVVSQLAQQRQALSEDVQRMQTSLSSISQDAAGVRSAFVAREEEQRKRRESALRAIVRGVEDLVKQEMHSIDEGSQSTSEQILANLDHMSALSGEASQAAIVAERKALEASTHISAMVSAWSTESGSLCSAIGRSQTEADNAAMQLRTTVSAATDVLNTVAESIGLYGSNVDTTLNTATDMLKELEAAKEATLQKLGVAKKDVANYVAEWSASLVASDSALESVIAQQADAVQASADFCKCIGRSNTNAQKLLRALAAEKECHSAALSGVSEIHAELVKEQAHADSVRCSSLASLVESASCVEGNSISQAEHFKQTVQHVSDAVEATLLAAFSAEDAARSHEAAIGSVRAVIAHADHAHRQSMASMEAHLSNIGSFVQLSRLWRDGVASQPLAAFEDAECLGDTADLPPKLAASLSGRRRPCEAELLADFRVGIGEAHKETSGFPGGHMTARAGGTAAAEATASPAKENEQIIPVVKQQGTPVDAPKRTPTTARRLSSGLKVMQNSPSPGRTQTC